MKCVTELLPLFFIRWYSEKYLERFNIDNKIMASPRPGVYIEVKPSNFLG
mgnify:CR=1 FL=1